MKQKLFKTPPRLVYIGKTPYEHESTLTIAFFARSGAFVLDGEERTDVPSGGIVIADAFHKDVFDLSALPQGAATFLAVDGGRLYGDNSLPSEKGCRLLISGTHRAIAETSLRELLREYESDGERGELVREQLFTLFMSLLVRLLPRVPRPLGSRRIVEIAKSCLDEHYAEEELSLGGICKELNIDRYYLTHAFKEVFGLPPVKYIAAKRLEKAERLLSETNEDIGVIAKECGYKDIAYFCRIFKNAVGMTALEYRAMSKQKRN